MAIEKDTRKRLVTSAGYKFQSTLSLITELNVKGLFYTVTFVSTKPQRNREFAIEMKYFYLTKHLNKTGEGVGGKFNGPSIKTVLKNTEDLENHLPETAGPFITYLNSINSLHKMCIENELSDNYEETIENFKENFEVVHQLFGVSQTLKIHIIMDHYSEYFKMTGTNFKNTNGEHHEALHHTLKTMERDKGLYMRKKTWKPYS